MDKQKKDAQYNGRKKSSNQVINLADDDDDEENGDFNNDELDVWNFQQIMQNQQQVNNNNNQIADKKSTGRKSNNLQNQIPPPINTNELKINLSLMESTPDNSILKEKKEELIQSFANRLKTEEKKYNSEFSLNTNNQQNNQQNGSGQDSGMLDSKDLTSSFSSHQNMQNSQQQLQQQQMQQAQPDNQCQKVFKDIIIWIIVITFGGILILIFYSFLKIIIDQTREISKPHYEITNYNKTDKGISVLAQCIRCQQFFGDVSNPIADTIQLDILYMNSTTFEINMVTSNFTEWSLPNQEPFPHSQGEAISKDWNSNSKKREYFVTIKEKPLEIGVYRVSTSEKIFLLSSSSLIYSYAYKEYTLNLPSTSIYGIGHNNANFTVSDQIYTLWNQRFNPTYLPQTFSNSFHPVFLVREASNYFHLFYLRSSTPIDVEKQEDQLNIKMVAGTINLMIFIGDDKPQKAVKDFHTYLGGYNIPPLWSLGVHYKMNNIKSLTQLNNIKTMFSSNKIQLDVLWFDSSIYRDNKSFFFNKETFNITLFKELIKNLQIIPEIQPGIKIDQDSIAYTEGIQRDIFLKKNEKQDIVFGKNQQKQSTHYPDFFHPQIQDYTNDVYGYLFQDILNRGCYLVDNEVTDYTSISNPSIIKYKNLHPQLSHKLNMQQVPSIDYKNQTNKFNFPYTPGNHSLEENTLSVSYLHYGNVAELYGHNLFSLMQTYSVYQYQHKLAKSPFPFIVSQSTSPGFGKYGAHLVELEGCDWKSLQLSLSNMLNYNILGIPQVGFTICPRKDQFQNIDEELFARWMQLSVFYSFYIVESDAARPSEFLTNPKLFKYYKNSFSLRQILSKYLYTLFFLFQGTGSLIKPLFFDFPQDELLYSQNQYINEQFLVGDALMVTPIFQPNKNTIFPYFPQDSWFDFYTGEQIKKENQQSSIEEIKNSIDSQIPIFMRGGTIVPLQTGYDSDKIMSDQTTDYDFLIAFKIQEDGTMYAEGNVLGKTVFSDSSIYDSCISQNCLVKVQVFSQTVVVRPPEKSKYKIHLVFDTIIPYISIDVIKVRNLILMVESRRVVYQANYTINGKSEFNFSVTP